MKKFFTLLLALSLLMGCCAQAEVVLIGSAPEPLELHTPTMPSDELEFVISAFIHMPDGYTHQNVTIVLEVQNWSIETIDAATEISFEVCYDDFAFLGVCASGESVPIEMLMNQTVSYTARIPNALVYGEEATSTEFVVNVNGWNYTLTTEQLTPIERDSFYASVDDRSFLLTKSDGTKWTWGRDTFIQFGGSRPARSNAVQTTNDIVDISSGDGFTVFLLSDGTVCTEGFNLDGELGNGTADVTTSSYQYASEVLTNVTAISAGACHALALRADKTLWGWGWNLWGQVGRKLGEDVATPTKVLNNVSSISAGRLHTIALLTDGTLWIWGFGAEGAIGNGTTHNQIGPAQVLEGVIAASAGDDHTSVLLDNDCVYTTDSDGHFVFLMGNAVDVKAGTDNTLVLDKEGTLWGCAHSPEGALGAGTSSRAPTSILDNVLCFDISGNTAIAIRTDGSVWVWGESTAGFYEDDSISNSTIPINTGLNAFY